MTDSPRSASPHRPASWIIRQKDTGRVIAETFSQRTVDKINTAKYEAVPILAYLQSLNRHD